MVTEILSRSDRMDLAQDIFDRLTESGALKPDLMDVPTDADVRRIVVEALTPIQATLNAILALLEQTS